MIKNQTQHVSTRWGSAKTVCMIWTGIALAVLFPAMAFLHGAFPIFTIVWLGIPLVAVFLSADANPVGFRRIPWRLFLSTTLTNLGVILLVTILVEPWSHAYRVLVQTALASTPPDTTFAWLTRFDGLAAWVGLILYSGLVTIFGEELFFRGWLLQTFQRRMRKTWSIVLQATLFTALQALAAFLLPPLQGVVYVVIYSWLAIGIVGGWAAARTQSIWPSLVSATIWNAIMIALVL